MKKIHRSQLAWAAFALALAAGSLVAQDGDASARKPMLLAEALKARDEGNLQTAKEKFEAILAIDPKDMGANEGLTSVNAALAEATAATEHLIEDVHRVSAALGSLATTTTAGARAALFESRRALLVVKSPFRFVGQHLIDAGDLFKFFLSGLIAGVTVWVKLHRFLAIGFLNFIRRRALGNAEQGVIIFFHRRRTYLFAGPVETKTAAGRRTRSCNDQPGRATRVTEPSGTVSLASCETASW